MSDGQFAIRILEFREEYKHLPDGSTKVIDWVEYCRPGMANMATNTLRITDKVKEREDFQREMGEAYKRWKQGQEIPETGTPVGAWPGLTPDQVKAFKAAGIKTVEDIAIMTDRMKSSVKLPGLERLKAEAKMFLEAKDQRGVEIRLQQQHDEIEALKAMLAERMEDAPKRRGRPPKAAEHSDEEEQAA